MPPRSSRVKVLCHLKPCKKCGYYVGPPILCKGATDPTHKDYWYEKCLNNAKPIPDSCDYFEWLPDIQHGKAGRGKKMPCPGPLCGDSPNTLNGKCTFGVCIKCCRHLQPLLPVARACTISDHHKDVVYPTEEESESKNVDKPRQLRSHAAASKGSTKKSVADKAPQDMDKHDQDVLTPSRAPPKRKSHVTPTTPAYQARILALDAEQRMDEEHYAKQARQDYAQSQVYVVTLRWWKQDGGDVEVVEFPIDNPSIFHPKDIPMLCKEYHCDTERFQYYDSKQQLWIFGSKDSASRDLKKLHDDDLCYRSNGVTWGEGMPGPVKRRSAANSSPAEDTPHARLSPYLAHYSTPGSTRPRKAVDDTPSRPLPQIADNPNTPVSIDWAFYSPADTTPPRSGSSTVSDVIDNHPHPLPSMFDFNFDSSVDLSVDFMSHALTSGPSSASSINESKPHLPALFPMDSDISAVHMSSFERTVDIQASPPLDLSTAPRGCSKNGWPWRYVCDMAAGFDTIRSLEDSQPPMSTKEAFQEVFKAKWASSTYHDQLRAWTAAGKVAGERERWIRIRCKEGGEWKKFMDLWRKHH